MYEDDSRVDTIVEFGKIIADAAYKLAANADLTQDQALKAVHAGVLLLRNCARISL